MQCVLVAVLVINGGCRSLHERLDQRMSATFACPSCHAHRVDTCRCFPKAENAGYCETNWVSMQPVMGYDSYVPAMEQPAEEIPRPEISLEPSAPSARYDDRLETDWSQGVTTFGPPTAVRRIAHWQGDESEVVQRDHSRRQRFTDMEDGTDEYYRDW